MVSSKFLASKSKSFGLTNLSLSTSLVIKSSILSICNSLSFILLTLIVLPFSSYISNSFLGSESELFIVLSKDSIFVFSKASKSSFVKLLDSLLSFSV